MNFGNLIGQVIDGKYKIERQLGKGGMGTVYLATHLGTERPVAVKVIVQQFMERPEFIERFRREARAAGRLRHPNVVDVTDFGIAEMKSGKVAYLVMEYLDGCTLGEILDEEKQLPLMFSLDILEQVCSAVHAAHEQGIIHRDLKPDNIWLEPNLRGGYTVKVLDFGIAKLEEHHEGGETSPEALHISVMPTQAIHFAETLADDTQANTIADGKHSTIVAEKGTAILTAEAGTLIQNEIDFSEKGTAIIQSDEIGSEEGTALFPNKQTQNIQKEDGTRLMSQAAENTVKGITSTSELTRVGAVLGTPLYMSPEQCRGEKLSPRSDIYSLGIIAYQMLGGKTPFEGDFTSVMSSHKETEPPILEAKKIPKKVKQVVMSSLAKNTDGRPQTAQAFASKLRAGSEGIGELLRRSLVIYSEHLPKFLFVAFLAAIPSIILTFTRVGLNLLMGIGVIEDGILGMIIGGVLGLVTFFVQIFTAALMVGVITWIVAQFLAVPLRPIDLRAAFKRAKSRWKQLASSVTVSTLLSMLGTAFCILPGIWLSARYMLIAPSIMMEDLSGKAAFRRSVELVKRSYRTVLATAFLVYFVPGTLAIIVGISAASIAKNVIPEDKSAAQQTESPKNEDEDKGVKITINGKKVSIDGKDEDPNKKMVRQLRESLSGGLFELVWSPITIFITSFTSVVTALLYFKTRLAGGESMQDLLEQFEETDRPKSKWQQRVQNRLLQSGRVTSKP